MQELQRNEALRLASPYPYTLATVLDADGRPNAIGLGWWTFTSWSPLHLAISVGHGRYSHQCLTDHCGEFVLNFPAADQARGAWLCGTRSGRKEDKLEEAGLELVPSLRVKPPTLAGVTVAFECRVYEQVRTGDHTLFIGEVLAHRGDPERTLHLYSVHYEQLVGIDAEGKTSWNLEFRERDAPTG